MNTISASSISQKMSSFLDGRVSISAGAEPELKKSLAIGDLIYAVLSGIQDSQEIQDACTNIDAVFTGSYLAQEVVALHPIVNDKDLKIEFRLKDGTLGYGVYLKVRKIVAKYLMDQVKNPEEVDPSDSLLDIGAQRDHYAAHVKKIKLGFVKLNGETGDLPLEITMVFADRDYLTHLTNIDSLEVPLKVCGSMLGSDTEPREFILRSKEGINVEDILFELEQKKITSVKEDWANEDLSYFELARYFIWICEKCTESGSSIFSCFYQKSIEEGSLINLWKKLYRVVNEKRLSFTRYPFVLFCNFLFHAPPFDAVTGLLEMQNLFDDLLKHMPIADSLRKILYTEDNRLKPDALFLLSCHLPLLAERVVCVDHLGRNQLQCCFSEKGVEFSIVVPLLSLEEGCVPWMREIFMAESLDKRICDLAVLAVSSLPLEERKIVTCELFECVVFHLKKNPSLWPQYKNFLGEEHNIQEFMYRLFQIEEEIFFEILSLDGDLGFVYGLLEKVFPQLKMVSESFQERYKNFPKSQKDICTWLVSLSSESEGRFFEALSFVQKIFPEEKFSRFICRQVLKYLLYKGPSFSPAFSTKYKGYIGSNEEISQALISLLPQQEDFFCQALSFISKSLVLEEKKEFLSHVIDNAISFLHNDSLLWEKFQKILGGETIQEILIYLFVERRALFMHLLSLEKNSGFVCELLKQLFPLMSVDVEFLRTQFATILQLHVNNSKPWQVLCLRFFMEAAMENRIAPNWLRVFVRKSGSTMQNGKICIQPSAFPKLLPTKEEQWVVALKLALSLQDSSCLLDALRAPLSEEGINAMKQSSLGIDVLKPIFLDLIDQGRIEEAVCFIEYQKRAWDLISVLPWYVQLFHKTKFPSLEISCKEISQNALQAGINPWSLYAIFASMPQVLPLIEPSLPVDSALAVGDKNACLKAIIHRIPILMEESRIENACQLAAHLLFLGASEDQVIPLLSRLFELSTRLENLREIAFLMYSIAPSLTRNLIENFRRPYLAGSGALSHFPIDAWMFALLETREKTEFFSLLLEQLEKFVRISAPRTVALVHRYATLCSEEDKENLALAQLQWVSL